MSIRDTFKAMRQASRDYDPPPITIGLVFSTFCVVLALYLSR
jgi:hypothetical protein